MLSTCEFKRVNLVFAHLASQKTTVRFYNNSGIDRYSAVVLNLKILTPDSYSPTWKTRNVGFRRITWLLIFWSSCRSRRFRFSKFSLQISMQRLEKPLWISDVPEIRLHNFFFFFREAQVVKFCMPSRRGGSTFPAENNFDTASFDTRGTIARRSKKGRNWN